MGPRGTWRATRAGSTTSTELCLTLNSYLLLVNLTDTERVKGKDWIENELIVEKDKNHEFNEENVIWNNSEK